VHPFAAEDASDLAVGELRLLARPSKLGAARDYARRFAAAFGLDEDDCYDFVFATNEAVTNAIKHGAPDEQGYIRLRMHADGDRLTLAVRDYGTFIPPLHDENPTRDGGRGFSLMTSFMDEVRVHIEPGCTTIYLSKTRA
jgi:anti-sigma regulatory factor (Ser/Thr protein kinase)